MRDARSGWNAAQLASERRPRKRVVHAPVGEKRFVNETNRINDGSMPACGHHACLIPGRSMDYNCREMKGQFSGADGYATHWENAPLHTEQPAFSFPITEMRRVGSTDVPTCCLIEGHQVGCPNKKSESAFFSKLTDERFEALACCGSRILDGHSTACRHHPDHAMGRAEANHRAVVERARAAERVANDMRRQQAAVERAKEAMRAASERERMTGWKAALRAANSIEALEAGQPRSRGQARDPYDEWINPPGHRERQS